MFPLLVKFLFTAVILLFVLRIACQLSQVRFHNRLVFWIVQLTDILIRPARKFLPGWKYFDLSTLLAGLLVTSISYILFFYLYYSITLPFTRLLLWSVVTMLSLLIDIYFWATLITVLLSWIAPFSMHPVAELAKQLIHMPVGLLRRYVPSLAGLDFSPMIFILALTLADSIVVSSLRMTFHVPLIFSLGL